MNARSRVHMLTVAAERLEQIAGNPKLVADLRAAATAEAERLASGGNGDDNQARIDALRTLFHAIPNGGQKEAFKRALLQQAYDHMWDGNCMAVDALTDFLPSLDVEAMFEAWENDDLGKEPKSKFWKP